MMADMPCNEWRGMLTNIELSSHTMETVRFYGQDSLQISIQAKTLSKYLSIARFRYEKSCLLRSETFYYFLKAEMESLDPHIFSMFTYLDVMPGQADTLQGLLAWCPHVPRVTHDGICLLFLSLYLSLSLSLSLPSSHDLSSL